jgi:hypothetical protein
VRLDPRDRKSWEGLFDLLQAPAGYRLTAAIGTSFGLSIDALTAALLAMCDADAEALAGEPVAGVMAITRLQSKVRVLVHPGTISGNSGAGVGRVVALMDRLIVEVQPGSGLFHPKVWALRFERLGASHSSQPQSIGRILVASRNLAESTCFELCVAFDGVPARDGEAPSTLCSDVADALRAWMTAAKVRVPESVWRLPPFIRQLALEAPNEATEELRLRWQGPNRQSLANLVPARMERTVVVSPFLRPDFLSSIVGRTRQLWVISTPEALDALDDETFASLESVREAQGSAVLYQVADLGEPEEGGHIDSLHAKVLLTEDARQRSATYIGSANATGPGWGIGSPVNVEAMVEMRPGVGIDRFLSAFVRENGKKVHPWIVEYDRSSRTEPDSEQEMERQMLAALRQIAQLDFELRYESSAQRLTLSSRSSRTSPERDGVEFDLAPLLLTDRPGVWTPLRRVASAPCRFDDVPLDKVTAFVVIRASSKEPPVERRRLLLARLNLSEAELDQRDAVVRDDIMAKANPAAVLNALVRGLSHLSGGSSSPKTGQRAPATIRQLLEEANLERLLQAIAIDQGLVSEMRLLLGPSGGESFRRFCDDLEHVVRRVHAETAV